MKVNESVSEGNGIFHVNDSTGEMSRNGLAETHEEGFILPSSIFGVTIELFD